MAHMGCDITKPVFRVSHKARIKPVSSATEIGWKIEISPVTSLDTILFQKVNSQDADQSALMPRLICAFVVRKHGRPVFSHRDPYYFIVRICAILLVEILNIQSYENNKSKKYSRLVHWIKIGEMFV